MKTKPKLGRLAQAAIDRVQKLLDEHDRQCWACKQFVKNTNFCTNCGNVLP